MTRLTVYGHPACPMVPPVRTLLAMTQVPYTYINIHADAAAREQVRTINHGNESVPTLVFADGSTLTEPSLDVLAQKLQSLGYAAAAPSPLLTVLLQYQPLLTLLIGAVAGGVIGGAVGDSGSGLLIGTLIGFGINLALVRVMGQG